MILEEKWPVLGRHERAAEWLRIWVDLGRAPRTIDAYARGLAEYLLVCEREGIDRVDANRSQIALFVKDLRTQPSRRGTNIVVLDSGSGLANATMQQRLSVTWNLAASGEYLAAVRPRTEETPLSIVVLEEEKWPVFGRHGTGCRLASRMR